MAYWSTINAGRSVRNYDQAKTYLQQGRKKHYRPLYTRGLILTYKNKDIAVRDRWYNFDCLLFHPDGTLTIQTDIVNRYHNHNWNPIHSQTVRMNIKMFSGVKDVYQKNHIVYITPQNALISPAKIRKCRICKGKGTVCYYDNKVMNCGYCNGTGKRDYGSKPISFIWDGSPLRFKDGMLVRQPPTELEKVIAAYVKLDNVLS